MTQPNALPPRGVLTDHLLDWLEDALAPGALVGDHGAPEEGGWTQQGTPNAGVFVPYVVVKTAPATPPERDGMNRRHASWTMTYALGHHAALRTQCDWLSDLVRALAIQLPEVADDAWVPGWSVVESFYTSLGGIDLSNATSPASFALIDNLNVRLERRR